MKILIGETLLSMFFACIVSVILFFILKIVGKLLNIERFLHLNRKLKIKIFLILFAIIECFFLFAIGITGAWITNFYNGDNKMAKQVTFNYESKSLDETPINYNRDIVVD